MEAKEPEKKPERKWYENRQGDNRQRVHLNVSITVEDAKLVDWIVEFLGTNRSEAMRTAIRTFVALMQAQERDMRRKENK